MAAAALYHSVLRLSAHWLECHDEASGVLRRRSVGADGVGTFSAFHCCKLCWLDVSGLPFYVNPYSQESTWDPPQEFQEAEWEGRLSTLV